MLDHVPNMRNQFKKFDAHQPDSVLQRDPEFLAQVDRILGGVESMINNVDDPVALEAAFDRLADAHLSMTPEVGLTFFAVSCFYIFVLFSQSKNLPLGLLLIISISK